MPTAPTWMTSAWIAGALAAGCAGDQVVPLASDDQTPPMGFAAVEAWLGDGAANYRTWAHEVDVHEARSPSPHGFNRVFSNRLIAGSIDGTDAWPRGAAAVKEIYAGRDDAEPIGYAVYLKLDDDSDGGASWYWYERLTTDPSMPPSADDVVTARRSHCASGAIGARARTSPTRRAWEAATWCTRPCADGRQRSRRAADGSRPPPG